MFMTIFKPAFEHLHVSRLILYHCVYYNVHQYQYSVGLVSFVIKIVIYMYDYYMTINFSLLRSVETQSHALTLILGDIYVNKSML